MNGGTNCWGLGAIICRLEGSHLQSGVLSGFQLSIPYRITFNHIPSLINPASGTLPAIKLSTSIMTSTSDSEEKPLRTVTILIYDDRVWYSRTAILLIRGRVQRRQSIPLAVPINFHGGKRRTICEVNKQIHDA